MFTSENIGEVLAAIAWPLAVLILSIVVIVWFGKHLQALIGRIKKVDAAGVSLGFGDASLDKVSPVPTAEEKSGTIAANGAMNGWNGYNAFWLGHDMMWTVDVLLRGAPGERIQHGLKSAIAHISVLPDAPSTITERLKSILSDAEKKLESDWTPDLRNKFAMDIGGLIAEVGKFTERFV